MFGNCYFQHELASIILLTCAYPVCTAASKLCKARQQVPKRTLIWRSYPEIGHTVVLVLLLALRVLCVGPAPLSRGLLAVGG
jgi:hypothetical protein